MENKKPDSKGPIAKSTKNASRVVYLPPYFHQKKNIELDNKASCPSVSMIKLVVKYS